MAAVGLTTSRKILMSVFTTLLLLGLAEGLLHLMWGPAPPYDMLVRVSQARLVVAEGMAGLSTAQHPALALTTPVTKTKRPRVIVLGGSSVVEPGDNAFPSQLGRLAPDLEIINLGSYGLCAANLVVLASELDVLSPDLVVVYTGHNDYSQDVFRGAVAGTRLWLVPVYRLLARCWLHALLARRTRGQQQQMAGRGHNTLVTQDATALDLRAQVNQRFAHDLAEVVRLSPAPVLLATLLRNPDAPPTGVLTTGLPDCERSLGQIIGGPRSAERLRYSQTVCGESSVTWWLRSQGWARSRPDDALDAFNRSLQLDAMPLRAPPETDDIIRRVAAESGASVVDLQAILGPLPPGRYFSDTLHLSRDGAAAVAAQLVPAIRARLGTGSAVGAAP